MGIEVLVIWAVIMCVGVLALAFIAAAFGPSDPPKD